jgi:ribosomal protein S18 acetylase RimI-like enzyme
VLLADEQWRKRAANPLAKTFAAMSRPANGDEVRILSSATMYGPLPVPAEYLEDTSDGAPPPLNWFINAVWTEPASRRKGIAAQVLAEAERAVSALAAAQGRDCLILVQVKRNNTGGAKALYEQRGYVFRHVRKEDEGDDNLEGSLLLKIGG